MERKEEKKTISLSVVIPVYNTARWIGECLDSILAQKTFDLEIVCIDDGSTDKTPQILKSYAEKDARIRIITKKNQGVSAARNTGIEAAQGEYIWFVDSDDTINPEMLESVYRTVISNNFPQVICFPTIRKVVDQDYRGPRNTRKEKVLSEFCPNGIHTGPETIQILLEENRFWHRVWTHLIKRSLLMENELRFLENLYRHEDSEFMLRVYRDAVSALVIPDILVNHRIREGSSIDLLQREKVAEDVKTHFDSIIELYRTYSGSEDLQKGAPLFTSLLQDRIRRCQKFYQELIQGKPEYRNAVSYGKDRNKDRLFDLLIRYPVETGRSLLALKETEKKLKSSRYRIYSMLPASARKFIRKVVGKG